MDAKDLFRLSKDILAGNEEGKEGLRNIVKGIIKELSKEEYEDTETGTDYEGEVSTAGPVEDIPGFEGTLDQLDDLTTIRNKPSGELDMDDILDKIFSQGMDSLTREEKDFLQTQSR